MTRDELYMELQNCTGPVDAMPHIDRYVAGQRAEIDEHVATRVQAERERIAGDIRRWLLDESLTYGEVGGPANAHDAGYWYGTREMAGRVLRMLGAGGET